MLKKTQKSIRRLGAVVMALAMAMSVMAINAFAVDASANLQLKKNLETVGTNASIQAETFEFTATYDSQKDTTHNAPQAGAVTISSASYGVGESGEKNINVAIDKTKFAGPGTYYFIIKETAGNTDGMTYSTQEKKLAVQIYADDTAPTYYVVANGNEAKNDGVFKNTYTTHKLTVAKDVTGNQGDTNKKFDITVTISGATGETYATNQTKDGATVTLTSGTPYTFQLADNESVEIYNLSAGDTYTVDEADYANEGYTVTGEVTTAIAIGTADKSVTVTNNKDASTPTGVIMNIAPYVLMVALAGGIAFFFLRRKHAE